MTFAARMLVLAVSLLVAACIGPRETSPAPGTPGAVAGASPDAIVVAWRDTGPGARRRAGATPRAYGWPGHYRGSLEARLRASRLARRFDLRAVEDWPIALLEVYCVVYEVPEGGSREALLAAIAAEPGVALAQPLNDFTLLTGSNAEDTGAGADVDLPSQPSSGAQRPAPPVDLARAHRWATGRGVRVAVVDTGLDRSHPGLEGRVRSTVDFVGRRGLARAAESHGLAVAGVIAARADPDLGVVGVAPQAELLALRACWHEDADRAVCNTFTLARALSAAVQQRAAVINLSLSGPRDPLLEQLLQAALRRGIVVVGAVAEPGSGRRAAGLEGSFPTALPGVIAVRSAENAGETDDDHLRAPGENVVTLGPGAAHVLASGSSMAAAHVSGVVALLLEQHPRLGVGDVQALLAEHMHPRALGNGRVVRVIDACEALASLRGEPCREPARVAPVRTAGPAAAALPR